MIQFQRLSFLSYRRIIFVNCLSDMAEEDNEIEEAEVAGVSKEKQKEAKAI